ncbi:bifunctional DNA primase/polymerase-like protein [Kribbella amoyensis]|uniref:Bifunctional DNA primase/polymerase-like protein n=1 Tax=Kribbella amoyensis TaxID=996641 RepID=A0A561BSC2_9ACTN|nr:bifunctional DNA primase/polymerase [Kribbella amoyensis]TWD81663.1 bifunctional DNA primase/polymerase-like protein [Kribbella amoyensis]
MTTNPASTTKPRNRSRVAAPDRLARAALWHANRGLAVFPLAPGSKVPAVDDWPHTATTDPDQITQWWKDAPYNIGVAAGPSGLLVIDLDRPRTPNETPPESAGTATSGREVLDELAAQAGQRMPRTWTVSTPSGGQHLYYRRPDGDDLGNSAGRLGWKIDTRGIGGYVVGAGSMIRGQRYRADVIRRPADLPDWITTALTPPPADLTVTRTGRRPSAAYGLAALAGQLDKLLASTPGSRNDDLNGSAYALGRVAATGALDPLTIHVELLSAALKIGLGRREAERTIESGLTAGLQNPRTMK